jgi:L,D-transpeptidase ErfK/SrfK
LTILLLAAPASPAQTWGDEVIGAVGSHVITRGESLIEIARQYDVGFNAIANANPDLDPFVPAPEAVAVIPTAWILPRAAAPGTVVVNLSEMRLYLFPLSPGPPLSFPVGIGSEGWETPLGISKVVSKHLNPTWYPPDSVRRESPELPASVPPGPDNPLGTHALRLSKGMILIHGTNKPWGVGRKVTHGCLRLYPEDIPHLYELVEVGTPVKMVREPVKVGLQRGRVHVEVHDDPDVRIDALAEAKRLLVSRGLLERVDPDRLLAVAKERRGLPVDVSNDPRVNEPISRAIPGARHGMRAAREGIREEPLQP